MNEILQLTNISHIYGDGVQAVKVLQDSNLTLCKGELVALVAPSGAGKSTLLHLAGLLETPTSGSIIIDGVECVGLNDTRRTSMRRFDIGFIYQFHHLLPELSARENIELPLHIAGKNKTQAKERADELLEKLAIQNRQHHRVAELSGGEQQRVAIARAVANKPKLLLADEPTGNLDPKTSDIVFASLMELVRSTGLAALIATHNHNLANRMDRIVSIEQGRIVRFH